MATQDMNNFRNSIDGMNNYERFEAAILKALGDVKPPEDFMAKVDEALCEYVDAIIETNDFDMEEIATIIGNNPGWRPASES